MKPTASAWQQADKMFEHADEMLKHADELFEQFEQAVAAPDPSTRTLRFRGRKKFFYFIALAFECLLRGRTTVTFRNLTKARSE